MGKLSFVCTLLGLLAACHPSGAFALSSSHQWRRLARPTARHAAAATPTMALPPSVSELLETTSAIPDNGVGVSEEVAARVEAMAKATEAACAPKPARRELRGVYDLLYCTGYYRSRRP